MKPKTLEKLFEYIQEESVHNGMAAERIKDELRALVKAESEPKPWLEEVAEILCEICTVEAMPPGPGPNSEAFIYAMRAREILEDHGVHNIHDPKGGDTPCATTKENLVTSPSHYPSVASNPPPDVQAEGRGDLGLNDALRIARGCLDYGGGYRSDRAHLEIYHHGIQTVINALEGAVKIGLKDSQCAALWRMGLETHKPHNPDNLQSPGEGYRFLDEDEIQDGPILREIGIWALRALEWLDGNSGWDKSRTYRVPDWMTREELAKKRGETK